MVDLAHSAERDDRDLAAMWRAIWSAKLVVMAFIVAAGVLAVIHLNTTAYFYTAQLKIVQASQEGGRSSPSRLGGLAAIAGLDNSGPGELPFILYKQGLHSRDVAEILSRDAELMHRIFASEWDRNAQKWVEPTNFRSSLISGVKRSLGLPVYPWMAPDAARLQQFLQNRIEISENANSPIVTVQFNDTDPQFAVMFLSKLSQAVDQTVRRKTLRKTGDYIAYLSRKLMTETLVEHRASLATALADQERQQMTASSSAPFAAEPIDRVVVSIHPTTPQPALVLLAALLAGGLLGVSFVLLRANAKR